MTYFFALGFKIIHISDIHLGSFASNFHKLEGIVDIINNEHADVIFFTGDLVNNLAEELEPLKPILTKLHALDGIYSVLGNHDYINILEIENFDDFYEMEKPKIEKVYKDCDVMITHINPSVKDENMNSKYKNNLSNTFFCFDGEEYLKNGSMKYWIFGHTHEELEYIEHNVHCICNPLGYFNESGNGKFINIRTIAKVKKRSFIGNIMSVECHFSLGENVRMRDDSSYKSSP